jgi:hypothetical protein
MCLSKPEETRLLWNMSFSRKLRIDILLYRPQVLMKWRNLEEHGLKVNDVTIIEEMLNNLRYFSYFLDLKKVGLRKHLRFKSIEGIRAKYLRYQLKAFEQCWQVREILLQVDVFTEFVGQEVLKIGIRDGLRFKEMALCNSPERNNPETRKNPKH